ncbi:HD-GYP domain-containing protein (c-di-GMP phosphodiesterase class II) [Pseudomonas fluvialis]|uniref:HD-GYP domain-containing protein (C-di-GMP phosphodiesterase class II) n=1 Tax=Pseudomonas fluvialis TaxID=1793966 RepID=A0A7X0BTA8_9PSED|nr:HD domain-containing phosphohydrolase [Pseudomonas fluvialis]MBB6341896.1 HD-GYP domain-containing protein (c-di-GMP phosphodiesterase class II) [Pseudomonas fluvialis]
MPSRRIPLYVHISYLFVGLLLAFALVSNGYQFMQTSALMVNGAKKHFELVGQRAIAELDALYRPTVGTVSLMAHQRLIHADNLQERLDSLQFLITALDSHPAVTALYMGYDSGDFFMIRPWRNEPALMSLFQPPSGTQWLVQSIQVVDGKPVGEHVFIGLDYQVIERRAKPDYQFDPRSRPWFLSAKQRGDLYVTDPYRFFSSGQVGVTFAYPAENGQAIAGVDVTLQSLNTLLQEIKVTPGSSIALLNAMGEVLGWQKGAPEMIDAGGGKMRLPRLSELPAPMLQRLVSELNQTGKDDLTFTVAGDNWQGIRIALPTVGGQALTMLMATPHAELLAEAFELRRHGMLIAVALLVLGVLLALAMARLASKPLHALTAEAEKIERFDFDDAIEVESQIAEVVDLSRAMGSMKSTIHRFLELSIALSSETNFQRLLAHLLREMQEITQAEGSLIYLADADASHIELARARWGGSLLDAESGDAIELAMAHGHPVVRAMREGKPCALSAEELQTYFPLFSDISKPLSLWVLPLKSRAGDLLGALALLVDEKQHKLSPELMAFVEALSTTSAVALNTQRLIDEQKVLLESFIQLIAGAIDAKSPYTGGHCQRVPELTKMLARAACAERDGPFASFALSEEQWEELHIAAWLHDCGKVTTPEYVVDKATKLETLYDRIHEVRMRFEVLKRDAEVACWQAIAAGADAEVAQQALAEQLRQLDDDFAFVAQCNEGGEFMAPELLGRLQGIAQRTWHRTLSDRIGISHEEMERKKGTPEPSLPVLEPLLADKPEHLFPRGPREQMAADNPWGFKVNVPQYLYNRGELYNLSVGRGTLAEEERYKINEHIIQTIIMLEKLPFPRHLRRVPEIAGGHHEKMDGSGYPKRLTREEMSVPARMMAIADIFEALTAVDRPYKKGKTLSEAIRIMGFMRKDQHIDAELFALFLRSGVYRDYAERYMPKALIDDVDITAYL